MSTSRSDDNESGSGVAALFQRVVGEWLEEAALVTRAYGAARVEVRSCTHCGGRRTREQLICRSCGAVL